MGWGRPRVQKCSRQNLNSKDTAGGSSSLRAGRDGAVAAGPAALAQLFQAARTEAGLTGVWALA